MKKINKNIAIRIGMLVFIGLFVAAMFLAIVKLKNGEIKSNPFIFDNGNYELPRNNSGTYK